METELEELLEVLKDEFHDRCIGIEENVLLENKKLDSSLVNQINLQYNWGLFYAKVISSFELAKHDSETKYARAYTEAISDKYKDVSPTDAKHTATCDEKYTDAKILENKFYRLKKEVEAIVDVIESRKYLLKDLTASIINGCQGTIL